MEVERRVGRSSLSGGVVVPVRQNPTMEAGSVPKATIFIADIHAARARLDAAASAGLFRMSEDVKFDYAEHYDSVDSWTSCLTKPRVGKLVADERLIQSACAPFCVFVDRIRRLRRSSRQRRKCQILSVTWAGANLRLVST